MNINNPILKIDPELKELIRPLTRKEFLQLEENLLVDGCIDPIITWNGFIIDGHNRYEICSRHNIPFQVVEKEFPSKDAVVAWMCAHQLGRRNLSEETRKYLIGLQYEAEKKQNKNAQGWNQYQGNPNQDEEEDEENKAISGHITAQRIATDNHVSYGTVQKYAAFSRAIEKLKEIEPEIVPKILSGKYKIAHKYVIQLATLPPEEIKKVNRRLQKKKNEVLRYKSSRNALPHQNQKQEPMKKQPSVKDMPAFDPDATITELTLTLPSWTSSIQRSIKVIDFNIVTEKARKNLREVLNTHIQLILDLLTILQEKD